jgi:hypothetical protein
MSDRFPTEARVPVDCVPVQLAEPPKRRHHLLELGELETKEDLLDLGTVEVQPDMTTATATCAPRPSSVASNASMSVSSGLVSVAQADLACRSDRFLGSRLASGTSLPRQQILRLRRSTRRLLPHSSCRARSALFPITLISSLRTREPLRLRHAVMHCHANDHRRQRRGSRAG